MKKVSVIIPVYNVEAYIEECVDSLLNQTYSNIEYLFIDDCGTDDSVAVAKKKIEQHSRKGEVRWIVQEKNQGQSIARNVGVEQATGDYIFFVDSDDYITVDCIETHMKYMDKYHPNMTLGSIVEDYIEERLLEGKEIFEGFLNGALGYAPWNRLITREFYEECHLRFEEGIIYEDYLWNFHLALEAQKIYIFSKKTYCYRICNTSSSHSFPTDFNAVSWAKVMSCICAICKEKNLISQKSTMITLELAKFRKMDNLIYNYELWKSFRKVLKVKFVPTWKLLIGKYGAKLQKRAFLSILPYFLYKPLNWLYQYMGNGLGPQGEYFQDK